MKNEYLVLYAIADMTAYHFLNNEMAKLNEKGDLVFIKDPKTYTEAEQRTYKMMFNIIMLLNQKLSEEAFNGIKGKYNNLLQGFKNNKQFKEYAPILVAMELLYRYAEENSTKVFNISLKSVKKLVKIVKKDSQVRFIDNFVLNSFILGEKFFKEITK